MHFKYDQIDLIVYDFDGVLTDNKVYVDQNGVESVVVNRSDGLAISIFNSRNIRQLICSKETNPVVSARAKKLNIPVLQGIDHKSDALRAYCLEQNLNLDNVIYIGNDLNDVEVMGVVGWPLCPADAYQEAKEAAKHVLKTGGGQGVVRELLTYFE